MQFDYESKKKNYSSPTVKRLTLEQSKHFLRDRTNCSDQEAEDLLQLLHQELQERRRFLEVD